VLVHAQSALHLVADALASSAMHMLIGAALALVEDLLAGGLVLIGLSATGGG